MRFRRWRAPLTALAVAVALAGCTSAPRAQEKPTPTSASAPIQSSPAPEVSTPTVIATAPPDSIGFPADNYYYRIADPVDRGAEQYATGTPIFEGGTLVAYRVAKGDILDFVADRFTLDRHSAYIVAINSVRRGSTGVLYAGDVVNLSAYTITKYGDINGKVLNDPPPHPMPDQH